MLEGVAVVSDIMASSDPCASSRQLAAQIRAFYASSQHLAFSSAPSQPHQFAPYTPHTIKQFAAQCLSAIKKHTPLVHQVRCARHSALAADQRLTSILFTWL